MLVFLIAASMTGQAPPPIVMTPVPAPPAPPPPPLVRVSTSPPSLTRVVPPLSVLEVRLASESGLLWEGPLRVGRGQGANIAQSRGEAAPASCPEQQAYGRSIDTSLRLALHSSGGLENSRYNVSVHWTRPGSPAGCPDGGSRTVQLEQTVDLAAGQEIVLRGDAGLILRLRRR